MPEDYVVIPMTCSKCHEPFGVHCAKVLGVGVMGHYRIDCPSCGALLHKELPGEVLDVVYRGSSQPPR